ncbi:hypothetical protein VTL71DRAFT_4046 [Oculimacula yallundae]|uniref:Uncharacterized protein n=1 Tax=Oculimacula yallundae TaxID=86028 RepID=A0ABR4C6E0_9HELO
MADETSNPGSPKVMEGPMGTTDMEISFSMDSVVFDAKYGNAVNVPGLSDESSMYSSVPITQPPQSFVQNLGSGFANPSQESMPIIQSPRSFIQTIGAGVATSAQESMPISSIDPRLLTNTSESSVPYSGGEITNQVQHPGQNIEANFGGQLEFFGESQDAVLPDGLVDSFPIFPEITTDDHDLSSQQFALAPGQDEYMQSAPDFGQGQSYQPMFDLAQMEYTQGPVYQPLDHFQVPVEQHQAPLQPYMSYPQPNATNGLHPYPQYQVIDNGVQGPAQGQYDLTGYQPNPQPYGFVNGYNGLPGPVQDAPPSHPGEVQYDWVPVPPGFEGHFPPVPKGYQLMAPRDAVNRLINQIQQPQHPGALRGPQESHGGPTNASGTPAGAPKKAGKKTVTFAPSTIGGSPEPDSVSEDEADDPSSDFDVVIPFQPTGNTDNTNNANPPSDFDAVIPSQLTDNTDNTNNAIAQPPLDFQPTDNTDNTDETDETNNANPPSDFDAAIPSQPTDNTDNTNNTDNAIAQPPVSTLEDDEDDEDEKFEAEPFIVNPDKCPKEEDVEGVWVTEEMQVEMDGNSQLLSTNPELFAARLFQVYDPFESVQ